MRFWDKPGGRLEPVSFLFMQAFAHMLRSLVLLANQQIFLSADSLNFQLIPLGAIVTGRALRKVPLRSSMVDSATSHKQDMGSSQQTR